MHNNENNNNYVTGHAKINNVSANYIELGLH